MSQLSSSGDAPDCTGTATRASANTSARLSSGAPLPNGNAHATRDISFDCLRCLCAFFIVYTHGTFPGPAGAVLISITQVAVPLFFMMSGYFYNPNAGKTRHFAQMKKMLFYFLIANLIYLAWELFVCLLTGRTAAEFIALFFQPQQLLYLVLLNESAVIGHIWYLGALLYVLIIAHWVERFGLRKWLLYLSPLLLAAKLLLGQYAFLFGANLAIPLHRNFLLLGLPCFYFGLYLREKNAQKKGAFLQKKLRLYGVLSILFAILCLCESWHFIIHYDIWTDFYLSTLCLAISMFLFTTECSKRGNAQPSKFAKTCAQVGAQYGLTIYIIHPLLAVCADIVMAPIGAVVPTLAVFYEATLPLIIFAGTLIFTVCYHWLLSRVRRKLHFALPQHKA